MAVARTVRRLHDKLLHHELGERPHCLAAEVRSLMASLRAALAAKAYRRVTQELHKWEPEKQ